MYTLGYYLQHLRVYGRAVDCFFRFLLLWFWFLCYAYLVLVCAIAVCLRVSYLRRWPVRGSCITHLDSDSATTYQENDATKTDRVERLDMLAKQIRHGQSTKRSGRKNGAAID